MFLYHVCLLLTSCFLKDLKQTKQKIKKYKDLQSVCQENHINYISRGLKYCQVKLLHQSHTIFSYLFNRICGYCTYNVGFQCNVGYK